LGEKTQPRLCRYALSGNGPAALLAGPQRAVSR
jgi:hypothetical protein